MSRVWWWDYSSEDLENMEYSFISIPPRPTQTRIVSTYEKKVKFATLFEGNQKTPFSIATTARFWGERNSFPWIAPLYPRYVPYIADC